MITVTLTINEETGLFDQHREVVEYEEMTDLYSISIARWNSQNISKIENIQNNKNNFKNKILPQIKKFFENRAQITLEHMRQFLKEFK